MQTTHGNVRKKASDKVEAAMHEKKAGTLKGGISGKKVTSRKQAIAIGLSEARKEGRKNAAPPLAARSDAGYPTLVSERAGSASRAAPPGWLAPPRSAATAPPARAPASPVTTSR